MRAKMSDREARADIEVFDSLPRPEYTESRFHAGAGIQAEDIWLCAAEAEARAILAETEPEGHWSGHLTARGILPHNERMALVEALAAFVAEEV